MPESELSILLIEDEPDAARLIQHVLSAASGGSLTVQWAADLRAGLALLDDWKFQAVLLDLHLPDSSGYETFARVRQKAPDPAILVLTGNEDEGLALQAVRAGADDYLPKSQIRDRFLLQRIRHAVERNRLKRRHQGVAPRNGQVWSFLGAKGGSGTTTVAINVASALADSGKSVIAIELADYGSFGLLLNHSPAWDISMLLRAAPETITREAVASCLEECRGGFRILCAAPRVEDYLAPSAGQARALIAAARTLADYVLVDLASPSAPASKEMIRHSVATTLVLERNRLGLETALAKMPEVRAEVPRPDTLSAVLINKVPFTEFLTPFEFGRRLGCGILGVIPPAPDLYASLEPEAPAVLCRPDMPFSQSIQDLVRRLKSGTGRFQAA